MMFLMGAAVGILFNEVVQATNEYIAVEGALDSLRDDSEQFEAFLTERRSELEVKIGTYMAVLIALVVLVVVFG